MKTKMRIRTKIQLLAIILLSVALLAGCSDGAGEADGSLSPGGENGGQAEDSSALEGTTDAILQQVLDETAAALGEVDAMPSTLIDPITTENAPGILGLIPDDFTGYVDEATVALGALNVNAFQVAVVKCIDADSTQTINEQIKSGFDSAKWICVFPEQSLTVVSGSYVLLAVGSKAQTEALAEAFSTIAVKASAPEIFYEGETGGGGEDFGGGMAITLE